MMDNNNCRLNDEPSPPPNMINDVNNTTTIRRRNDDDDDGSGAAATEMNNDNSRCRGRRSQTEMVDRNLTATSSSLTTGFYKFLARFSGESYVLFTIFE